MKGLFLYRSCLVYVYIYKTTIFTESSLTWCSKADDKCLLKVYTTGMPDTSWYRIWEATEAIYAVCGKNGKTGYFRGLGKLRTFPKNARDAMG